MGLHLNIGNKGFERARKGEYIDKSGLIGVVNNTINTEFAFSCVTRSRRFGKSIAARMLSAYYDESIDSRSLFQDLEIARDPSFEEYRNKYPVIFIDMSSFVQRFHDNVVEEIEKRVKDEVAEAYTQG